MAENDAGLTGKVVRHIRGLLYDAHAPELTPELAAVDGLRELHNYLLELRAIFYDHVSGSFAREITIRGVLAGRLKAFQANILHLIWQVEQVAKGDFTQRVEFMGDLAASFNAMITQLDEALTALRKNEEELTILTRKLEEEVELRGEALKELSASEARFRYLAEHDPLTGVLNRRSFFELAEVQLEKAKMMKADCCLAILDIDHFKNFNDTHGHVEGDAAIRHITRLCNENLRRDDSMGRYGGEEFVFFFANASRDQGIRAAERMRERIDQTPFNAGAGPVQVTVSIGLVHIEPERIVKHDSRFLPFALGVADGALYEAKKNGRNQVCTADLSRYRMDADTNDLAERKSASDEPEGDVPVDGVMERQ